MSNGYVMSETAPLTLAHLHTNRRKCIGYLNNMAQDVKMITASG